LISIHVITDKSLKLFELHLRFFKPGLSLCLCYAFIAYCHFVTCKLHLVNGSAANMNVHALAKKLAFTSDNCVVCKYLVKTDCKI